MRPKSRRPQRLVALKHMSRFHCLAGECEDTCCQSWSVTVDQSHHARLRRLAGDRERFDAIFVLRPPGERTRDDFATIRMRPDDGRCPLLSPASTCTLHAEHGDDVLPDTCSFYPRYVTDIGGRLELSGSLSCPEVVRQALLAPDGVDLVEVAPELRGRAPVMQRPLHEDAPFVDELRGTMLMLLEDERWPEMSRLFFLVCLVREAAPSLRARDAARLNAVTERVTAEGSLAQMHEHLSRRSQPRATSCMALLTQIARLRDVARPPLRDDIERLIDAYVEEGALSRSEEGVTLTERFHPAFAARRARVLDEQVAARLTMATRNYMATFVMRELYLRRPSAELWALELALRVATWRFLLLSDDRIAHDPAALEARLTFLVYQAARVIDHRPSVGELVLEGMAQLVPTVDAVADLCTF